MMQQKMDVTVSVINTISSHKVQEEVEGGPESPDVSLVFFRARTDLALNAFHVFVHALIDRHPFCNLSLGNILYAST